MTALILELLGMLLAILAASELFTNALEHLGDRLRISEGVTGSLFAAVGTALPETAVPLLALFAGAASPSINAQIGTGAILGAPLMLSTLSIFLLACSALRRRGLRGRLHPERGGVVRDLNFFLAAFLLAALAMLVPAGARGVRAALAIALAAMYCAYFVVTLRASRTLVAGGHGTRAQQRLWLTRIGVPKHASTLALQLCASVALLLYGARGFIRGVEGVSQAVGVSPLLLSLLIIPIATELPEKVNSILWLRRDKDTLAVGNITGAMVFQGTLLPAFGILLTPWEPGREVLTAVCATMLAAAWTRGATRPAGIPVWALLANGACYVLYLALSLLH